MRTDVCSRERTLHTVRLRMPATLNVSTESKGIQNYLDTGLHVLLRLVLLERHVRLRLVLLCLERDHVVNVGCRHDFASAMVVVVFPREDRKSRKDREGRQNR